MLGSIRKKPLPFDGPDWTPFLPGIALWALALYVPLSKPLERLEQALAEGSMPEAIRGVVLTSSSLLLALAIGTVVDLLLSWGLGPSWASSLGLLVAGWGLFFSLASRAKEDQP